jgi:hypothetical protein
MSSCAGIFYFIYKGTDGVAKVWETYLRGNPDFRYVISSHPTIKRNVLGWNVSVVNDGGTARISYSIRQGQAGNAEAVVWLLRSAGTWSAVGARVRHTNGQVVTSGEPPKEHPGIDWD